MKRACVLLWIAAGLPVAGCGRSSRGKEAEDSPAPVRTVDTRQADAAPAPTRTLTIRWQRLVTDGGVTCARCAGTEAAIREAERTLSPALAALGIRVVVEEHELDMASFAGRPSESNRIWIGERTLEEILGASTGSSQCCGACAGNECRTLLLDGETYEAVPATLIVRAALKAAADLLGPATESVPAPAPESQVPAASCGCGAVPAEPTPCCGSH